MVRQKTSPPEDLISLTSRLPWWVCILLAIISYFVLHMIASRPAMTIVGPGQMGDAVTKGIVTTFAMFFQYIFPFAFSIAALLSGISSIRQKKMYENIECTLRYCCLE